jgi:predicted dehydrogenase
MAEQARVGVIGTSWWSDMTFLPYFKRQPRAALVAVCGRNRERAEEMAQKYQIPQVFTDYRAMIEKGGLDAVVVAAPDDQHYPMVMDALDAGLHVLCEKPLAMNAQQAREMVDKAEASGVRHMVFFTATWMPHFRYFERLARDGFVGKLYHCNIRYVGGYARGGQYQWRFDANRANGVLGDLGSHMIQLARSIAGEIVTVSASLAVRAGSFENAANDYALLNVEFASGARGSIEVSAVGYVGSRAMVQGTEVYGMDGTLETTMELATGGYVRGARRDEEPIRDLPVPDEYWEDGERPDHIGAAVSRATRVFAEAILDGKPLSPNFYDGLKVQEVIDAARESDSTGQRVAVGTAGM